jgi:hypothetical protein
LGSRSGGTNKQQKIQKRWREALRWNKGKWTTWAKAGARCFPSFSMFLKWHRTIMPPWLWTNYPHHAIPYIPSPPCNFPTRQTPWHLFPILPVPYPFLARVRVTAPGRRRRSLPASPPISAAGMQGPLPISGPNIFYLAAPPNHQAHHGFLSAADNWGCSRCHRSNLYVHFTRSAYPMGTRCIDYYILITRPSFGHNSFCFV